MSELKVYRILGIEFDSQFYHKPEADKVIAELEESHKMEVEQLLMEIVELKSDYKEACDRLQTANLIKDEQLAATRYNKYKRCLAMAMWCDTKADWYYGIGRSLRSRVDFFIKWRDKWFKLAEKFKEAK